jgi:DNA-binding transcriptional LysR family regulator
MHARDLRLLLYFAEIARQGSIRGAARALSVSPPVVSTALRDLEAAVGVDLITRTTRKLTLTDRGEACLAAAEKMIAQADAAMNVAATDRPVTGTLRLSAPIELCGSWLAPILTAYRTRFPEVRCYLDASDSQVDLSTSDADIAIRARFVPETGPARTDCQAPIAYLPLRFVCAPDRLPETGSFDDKLNRTGLIGARGPGRETVTARYPDGRTQAHSADIAFAVNNKTVALDLVRQGFGAALLIEISVADDLAKGTLVDLDPDLDFGFVAVHALMRDTQPSPAAAAFLRLAQDRA